MSCTRARAAASAPRAPPTRSTVPRISSSERWLVQSTVTPAPTRSRTISRWRSEKASTRSGSRARILSSRKVVNPPTFAFSRTASGRWAVPGTPTTRSPAPTRYAISAVSEVRQTMRCGKSTAVLPYTLAFVDLAVGQAPLEAQVFLPRHGRRAGGENFSRPARAVGQQIDRHRGQSLGGCDVGEAGIDDLEVGGVTGAAGAAHVGMEDGHDVAEVAHVRRAGPVADLAEVLGSEHGLRVLLEEAGHGGVAGHGKVARQGLDLHLGPQGQGPRPQRAIDLGVGVEDRLHGPSAHVRL